MLRHTSLALFITLALVGCNKGGKNLPENIASDSTKNTTVNSPLLIGQEDIVTLHNNTLASGPAITGSVQPERRADLRAEVSSVVLQVLKENGEAVKKGDVLVRLDDTSIRDALASSEEAARVSEQGRDQAERQFQRLKTLRASGMTSMQQLEDAEIRRNNSLSDLAAAKARSVQARQQLQRTLVKAPFDGIVSDRKVSAGDTAQIGKELIKVIDPTSLRFEGLVSADKINDVKIGQTVSFKLNGQEQRDVIGKVKRIDPAANPTTRQVGVLVAFAGGMQPRVSGLYAEGHIETESVQALTSPDSALVRSGDKTFAWRLKDGVLHKVPLVIGARDQRSGDYAVRNGLAEGDQLIRNPNTMLKEGQKVSLSPEKSPHGLTTIGVSTASATPTKSASTGEK